MKRLLLLALAMALPHPQLLAAADNPDATFYSNAAERGMAEMTLARLAQEKSSSQSIRRFAAMMSSDHGVANEKLKIIAAANKVELPKSAGAGLTATSARLQLLSGSRFDESYIREMIKAHKEGIGEFQKEAASGGDSDAKVYAKATLPMLRAHLRKIRSIAATFGMSGA